MKVILLELSHGLYCLNNAVQQAYQNLGRAPRKDVKILFRLCPDPISTVLQSGRPHHSTSVPAVNAIIRNCMIFDCFLRWDMEHLETYPWVAEGIRSLSPTSEQLTSKQKVEKIRRYMSIVDVITEQENTMAETKTPEF